MLNNQRGSVTAMGIILIVFFTIMLAGLVPMLTTELKFTKNNRDVLEAQYAAEAGAKRAISGINQKSNHWDWSKNNSIIDLYSGSNEKYLVTTNPVIATTPVAGTTYEIKSTGYAGDAQKTVTVYVTLSGGGNEIPETGGATNVKTINATSLNGTNANVYTADAFPSGLIGSGSGERKGNETFSMPTYDFATFKSQARPLPTLQMNQNYLTTGNGLYYYDGNLTISQNNAQLLGLANGSVIFASGNITFESNASGMNVNSGIIYFVSNGDINVKNDANFVNVGLIAQRDITFTNGMHMQPGIVVTPKTLNISGNIGFNVDKATAISLADKFNTIMSKYAGGGDSGGSGGSGGTGSVNITGWSK